MSVNTYVTGKREADNANKHVGYWKLTVGKHTGYRKLIIPVSTWVTGS